MKMRLNRFVAALALTTAMGALGFGMSGCSSAAQALGVTKVTPDEFRVVTKAPLTIPPDYSLRPPTPGEPRPQELQPESAARNAVLGERASQTRSDGEKLLAAKAGGDKADPLVRYVVDDEFGDLAHKEPSFADKVMFWHKDKPQPAAANTAKATGADAVAPLDPAVEAARLKNLTGDKPVQIQRDQSEAKLKLPGL
jgi:hypothetical protein